MAGSRAAGNAASRIARPAIRQLLKGRKLKIKPKGHVDRPRFQKTATNNYTNLPKPFKDPATGRWQVHAKRHDGWNRKEYRTKVDAMKQAGKDGKLNFVDNTSSKRTTGQRAKRRAEEDQAVREAVRIYDRGKHQEAQDWLDDRLRRLDAQEADHRIELQVGGQDQLSNLDMIDAATNHGMGGQLRSQLAEAQKLGMQPGDLVEIVELPGLLRNR
ncbi:hypothetical protein AB0A73_02635 [Glycomyces sp. NPDC047369]